MLAGRLERRDVPHAEGEWVEFRTLSGLQLQTARERNTERSLKSYVGMLKGLDEQTIEAIQGIERKQKEQRQAQGRAAPESDYDEETLITWGINDWSLQDFPCTDDNKKLLDAQTCEWAISVILEMNTRPLAPSDGSSSTSSGENSHRSAEQPISSTPSE